MKAINFPKYSQVPVIGRLRWCLEITKKQNLSKKTIVDIGSSTGLFESKLLDQKFKKLIAFDPNEKAVEYSKKNIKDKRVELSISVADKIPVKDNSVDLVCLFDVIEHVPMNTELNVFKEVKRVLKKNGTLLLTTPNNSFFTNLLDPAWYLGHRHYKPQDLKQIIQRAGLKIKESEVRGSIWSSLYMLWFYIMKWIFGQSLPRNKWIESREDEGYNKPGIFTLYIKCSK